MTITLTREEAQQVFHALKSCSGVPHWPALIPVIETLRARLSAPEPGYRDVVIKGDLWRIEFLPDHAASVVLVRANYEAQPEPEPVAFHKDAPERIYLQVCDDSDCDEPFCEHHDVSWCQDRINDSDVEYVRADIAPPQREWQGLTQDELDEAIWAGDRYAVMATIEAKLKEKNA